MTELLLDGRVTLHCGNCLDVLATLPANSIDSCVTDPPYHLTSIVERFGKDGAAPAKDYRGGKDNATGAFARTSRGFMGREWDGGDIAFRPETWAAVLRVLKPGGHLLAFSASRTVGRMQVAIEDGGFETRDCILDIIDGDPRVAAFVASLNDAQRCAFLQIAVEASDIGGLMAWLYGSGFPKSHNIALDFEKTLCDVVEDNGRKVWRYRNGGDVMAREAPFRSNMANAWAGWGTALKPAFEPIVMARKPLDRDSIADNVEAWGDGAINIDACRISAPDEIDASVANRRKADSADGWQRPHMADQEEMRRRQAAAIERANTMGRWPGNVIHDGSDAATRGFPDTGAGQIGGVNDPNGAFGYHGGAGGLSVPGIKDAGSAARFFYSSKADDLDRVGSNHPTVKPVDLMQWLVRMVTRKGGTVLDLFAGTGTTGEAAFREGCNAVLIERETEYQADIRRRMALALAGRDERKRESTKAKQPDKPFGADTLFGNL